MTLIVIIVVYLVIRGILLGVILIYFFDKYNYLCIYNNYDKYRIIKKRYKGYIVFIKVKNRYYTYDDDLIYINGLFGTNVYYFKYYKLLYIKMDYVILEGNCIMLYKYCKENVK